VTERGSVSARKRAERLARRQAALAARASMSPAAPATAHLRVATWNLNSIRARLGALERFLVRAAPDVLCLQETKAPALSDQAVAMLARRGYSAVHVGSRSYNGVAVAARHPLEDVLSSGDFGDEHLDREPRVVSCLVEAPVPLRVVSVYVPHGREIGHWHYEYKLAFIDALADRARRWLADDPRLVVAGDVNIAPTDSDVFHPDAFVGSVHVTGPERDALARLLDAGLVDADVAAWGARARRFTWWDHGIGYHRNLGMRLDLIAADHRLAARLDTTWIDHVERSTSPASDHAALIADFHRTDDTDRRRPAGDEVRPSAPGPRGRT
jgi:exodeoxyribonuclease III